MGDAKEIIGTYKKPEIQKNAPTAKKPYAVFPPNENKTGSFPKEAM